MTKIQTVVVAAALAIGMAAPASAGVSDPEVIIYRFPGVRDNGGVAFAGEATDGTLPSNMVLAIPHLNSMTAVTHPVIAYIGNLNLNTGNVGQGTTAIAATLVNVICTAMTIDASTAAPVGVALRGIRFSPVPGSQE